MQTIKITEDLIIILALDQFLNDLTEIISNVEDPSDEVMVGLVELHEETRKLYQRKSQNIPQYEHYLNKFLSEEKYSEDEGPIEQAK